MTPSRWLSFFLAWTLLFQSLAPALAFAPSHGQGLSGKTHNRIGLQRQQLGSLGMGYGVVTSENHEYLVDTSQPYAEVIQEHTWASNASGNATSDALIYRYDIGLDRLHYFKYQVPINGPPTLGSPVLSEWLLFDGLGSTRALVGDSGSVVDEFGYNDAFGIPYRVTASGGRVVAPPGFFLNGQQWEGGSGWGGSIWSGSPAFNSGEGLYFNRARYYQPGLGRFVGEDPYLGNSYDPHTLHRYLYVTNDSVNFIDPTGREGLVGTLTSLGIRTTLTARVGSVALQVYNIANTVAAVHNIYSDYILSGTISSWDAASLAFDFLPDAGRLFKNIIKNVRGVPQAARAYSAMLKIDDWKEEWRFLERGIETLKDDHFRKLAENAAHALGVTIKWDADTKIKEIANKVYPGKNIDALGFFHTESESLKTIYIHSQANPYVVLHELYHAEHCLVVGVNKFNNELRNFQKEWEVFKRIWNNPHVPDVFKENSKTYMNDILRAEYPEIPTVGGMWLLE